MVQGIRSRIARRLPDFVRKPIRMGEHYGRRMLEWVQVLREMRGVSPRDRRVLLTSALCAPVTALARLDGFGSPRLHSDLEVELSNGFRFFLRAGTDDVVHVLTSREPQVRALIEQILGSGDTFIDAGANIGFYSLIASNKVGPDGRVVAVEMMPPTAARLRDHLERNNARNVTVVDQALSDCDGDLVIARSQANKFGQASIVVGIANPAWTIEYQVLTTTLDSALSKIGAIRLIKMDLEGAERMALEGAKQVLARTSAVIFENNSEDRGVFELLEASGFLIGHIGGHDYVARRIP